MGFFWLGSFSALGTGGTSCFSRRFLLFFLRVSMENNPLRLDEGQFSLSFKWTDSMSLWLAQKDPFVATLLDETENSVALSREQSSSSEGHFLLVRLKSWIKVAVEVFARERS